MSYPYRYGINSLLLNDHGKKFLDAELVLGVEPRKDLYTPWFKIDRSDPQERPALEKLNSKVCVGESGKSTVMAPRSSRSSVRFDLESRGDTDEVVPTSSVDRDNSFGVRGRRSYETFQQCCVKGRRVLNLWRMPQIRKLDKLGTRDSRYRLLRQRWIVPQLCLHGWWR